MVAKNERITKKKKHDVAHQIIGVAIFMLIVGGVLGFLVFTNFQLAHKRGQLQGEVRELQTKLQDLKNSKNQLQFNLEDVQTDDYAEKVLRENGLYQKPGEEAVTILTPKDEQMSPEAPKKWSIRDFLSNIWK